MRSNYVLIRMAKIRKPDHTENAKYLELSNTAGGDVDNIMTSENVWQVLKH